MKALSIANKARQLKNDPIGFIVDGLIAIIVNLFIPIPLAGALVSQFISQFKAPLLGLLASLILLAVFMITVVTAIITLPIIASSGFFSSVINFNLPFVGNSLNIPPDPSFFATNVPKQNPFGGSGMDYTNVTAYFHDPDYFLKFGMWHTGLDLVPSDDYFKNSQTYKNTQKVVIFATMNGTVNAYTDEFGGETVEITNNDNSIRVKYIHFSTTLVETGQTIVSGTPVGIMGETGFATGVHVHYEIQTNDNGNWISTDPLNFIH